MKFRKSAQKQLNPADQQMLEGMLVSTIRPMSPSTNFLRSLEDRLMMEAEISQAQAQRSITNYFLIAAVAGLAVSLITITGIRIAIGLVGFLGLAQAIRGNAEDRNSTSRAET